MRRWSLLAALLGVFLLVMWPGCSNPNLAGGKLHFDQASREEDPAARIARFHRALETFKKAVQEMPEIGEARHWLGRTFAELDMPDSAAANFDDAARLDPRMTEEVRDTREHYYSRRYNSGLASADEAIKARAIGDDEGSENAFRESLEEFRVASIYRPDHVQPFTMRGKVYLNLGDVERAIELLALAREMEPTDESVLRDLFLVYHEEGDMAFQDAAFALQEADSTKAHTRFRVARDLYTKADEVMPGDPNLSFQLGLAAYELAQLEPDNRQELLEEAIHRYREVLEDNPVDLDVLYNTTFVLRDLGRYEEAREVAQRLVDLRPKDGTYRDMLGRIEGRLGNQDALLNGVVFGRTLRSGVPQDVGDASAMADQWGVHSDIKRRYLENGAPEEILFLQDIGSEEYLMWFYWSRGLAFGFAQGRQDFTSQFAPAGVLQVNSLDVTMRGISKYLTGILSNGGVRSYEYVRIIFDLYDENEEFVARNVIAEADELGPRGVWSFEILLSGEGQEAAVKAEVLDILAY